MTVLDSWYRLLAHDLVPKGGWFFYLLWALMFTKLYDLEHDMCVNAESSSGATDPKTFGTGYGLSLRNLQN